MQLRVKISKACSLQRTLPPLQQVRHSSTTPPTPTHSNVKGATHYDLNSSTLPPEPDVKETSASRDAAMRTMDMMMKAKKNTFKHFYKAQGSKAPLMVKVGDKGDEDWILDKRNPQMRYMEDNVGLGRGMFPRPRNDTFPKDYFTKEKLPWTSRHLPSETEELAGIEDPAHPYYRWEQYISPSYRNVLERDRPIDQKFESDITEHRVAHGGLVRRFLLNKRWELNALDYRFANLLKCAFQQWDGLREANVFILHTTSPGKVFCTGSDFRALCMAGKGHPLIHNFFREVHQLATVVDSLKRNAFMVLDGTIAGSGCIMALHAPVRLVTADSRMYLPDVAIGYFPDCGAVHRLSQLPHNLGAYILLSGCKLGPEDLLYLGIGSFYVEGGKAGMDFMQEALGVDRLTNTKRLMTVFSSFIDDPPNESRIPFALRDIERCFGQKSVQDIMTALATVEEEWAAHALHFMKGACPFSLAVTFEYIKRVKTMTFHESVKMDYRIALRLSDRDDFFEGIRARVIEQRLPKWTHTSVSQVPKKEVDAMFEPFDNPARELKIIESSVLLPKENYTALMKKYIQDHFETMEFPPWMPNINSIQLSKFPMKRPGEIMVKRKIVQAAIKKLQNQLNKIVASLDGQDAKLSKRLDVLTPNYISLSITEIKRMIKTRADAGLEKIMGELSKKMVTVIGELTAIEEGQPPTSTELASAINQVSPLLTELSEGCNFRPVSEELVEDYIAANRLTYWRRDDLTPHDRMSYWQNDAPISEPQFVHYTDYGWRSPRDMPKHIVLKRPDV